MKHRIRASALTLIVTAVVVMDTASASATEGKAEGKVLVFKTELSEATVFNNPQGCTALPGFSHILVNQTNTPVKVFGVPSCAGPSVTAQPGWGGHVPAAGGSFSA